MSAKTYNLNINKSDGTSESVSLTIPGFTGTHNIKFTLSNGEEIDAGNITVDETEHTYDLKLALSNGSTINVGSIITPIGVSKPTLESLSWAEIAEISEAGKASEYFAVGDEKTIELSTGEKVTLVIIGFNHDDLSNGSGKVGITFQMKNLLSKTYYMKEVSKDNTGWRDSDMRISILPTLFSQLTADMQRVIKLVDKKCEVGKTSSAYELVTTSDKLFCLSFIEINGTKGVGNPDEGEQYEYWIDTSNSERKKYLSNGEGDAYHWWTRSRVGYSPASYYIITRNGSASPFLSSDLCGVSFGFCV